MDRVFLDANVLFSAAYGSKGLQRLWDLAAARHCDLLVSAFVVEEAQRNLRSPSERSRLSHLLSSTRMVPEAAAHLACPIQLPEKDRPVLLVAVAARASHLLTGDTRHFGPHFDHTVQGVLILTPAEYLRRSPATSWTKD